MHSLNNLFSPINVGGMTLKNRLVMAPIGGHGYCPDGIVTERLKKFYAERAIGGVGLIILNISSYVFDGRNIGVAVHDDMYIQGLWELSNIIHSHGAKVVAQLSAGRRWSKHKDKTAELVGPSDVAVPRGGHPSPSPRPLTLEEIQLIVEEKGEEALRVQKAGFDAIEIHANVGTCLVSQFISPLTNHRIDCYGGCLENRYRLLLDILASCQKRVGKDYPIMCRISASDFLVGGNTIDDSKKAAPMLEKAGFSAIDVVTGWHEAPTPFFQASVPQGSFIYLAQEIKKEVRIPVIGGTKIISPEIADHLIADGKVDLIYMCRALIADPELPLKAEEGRFEDIRPCIACGHCFDSMGRPEGIACSVNPLAGKETMRSFEPAPVQKKVLVVGGGPAGMEAAVTAANRGHDVTLLEKRARLGGNLNIAVIPPFKEDIIHFIKYLCRQVESSGVKVKLSYEATAATIDENKPNVIILANGAAPLIPNIVGVRNNNVVTAIEVLTNAKKIGGKVIIIGGGSIGCETAEFLVGKAREITVIEKLGRIGDDITPSYRWVIIKRMSLAKINLVPETTVYEITEQGVKASHKGSETFFEGDTIVLAVGFKSNAEFQLQNNDTPVYRVGDCSKPGKIYDAVENGFSIACEI